MQKICVIKKNCLKLSDLANKFDVSIEGFRKIVKKIESAGKAQNDYWAARKRVTTLWDDRRIVRLVQENAKTTVREIKEQL